MKIAMMSALAALTLAAVCDDQTSAASDAQKKASAQYAACKAAATQAPVETPVVAAPVATDPNTMLVSVNGKKLTQGELDADIALFIESRKAQIPPERMEEAKKMVGEQMAQQFVMKTLLLDAVAAKGVTLTDAERKAREAEFVKSVAGRPDAPKSFAEMAEKHPFGKERGLKELEESLVIQKLLEQEVTSKIKVDAKEIDETLAKITADNKEKSQKAAGAEGKIKDLAKQLEGLKGDALAKKFAELAKANSDCPSKEKGGDLGEFARGSMVKEFEEVAFSSEPFVVSAPVKTQFGWHLIMVTKKIAAGEAKGETPASPEKVQASHILVMARAPQPVPSREDIEKGMKRQHEQQAMREFFEKLRNEAKIEAPGFPSLVPPPPAAPAQK